MIEQVDSTLPGFKRLRFQSGLNVLLAQKSPGATDRQTRNGVGKTSFVEIVHFLLGGDAKPGHLLRVADLAGASYSMRFDLAGARVAVSRNPEVAKSVRVDGTSMSNEDWKQRLGHLMFGLPDLAEEEQERFRPSFRSLITYFARRQGAGGFQSPQQHSTKQQPYDVQVSLSHLLGLDASIPQDLHELRQRESALAVFRKAAKDGAFGELVGKASDLRTRLTVHEARSTKLREQLSTFQVVPEYRELEREASLITGELALLANENRIDRELIAQLEETMSSEVAPRYADVSKAYAEAGVMLPGLVQRRFEEVDLFHRSIVENRRSHLSAELEAARGRVLERDRRMQERDARRAQVMTILRTGGALESFSRLQAELGRLEAQGESLRKRFEAAETLERKKSELGVARARLHRRLQDDHHERGAAIGEAILVFESLSNALYEREGSLTVSDTPNGPTFEVQIEASRSTGINNMQIFCFDMMLMELLLRRGLGPGFLIHDSHLFDGVDERQAARALEIGAERAARLGFQYIVTMNEDAVPWKAFHPGFAFDAHINPVRLTDATATGGLFGRRFE